MWEYTGGYTKYENDDKIESFPLSSCGWPFRQAAIYHLSQKGSFFSASGPGGIRFAKEGNADLVSGSLEERGG